MLGERFSKWLVPCIWRAFILWRRGVFPKRLKNFSIPSTPHQLLTSHTLHRTLAVLPLPFRAIEPPEREPKGQREKKEKEKRQWVKFHVNILQLFLLNKQNKIKKQKKKHIWRFAKHLAIRAGSARSHLADPARIAHLACYVMQSQPGVKAVCTVWPHLKERNLLNKLKSHPIPALLAISNCPEKGYRQMLPLQRTNESSTAFLGGDTESHQLQNLI